MVLSGSVVDRSLVTVLGVVVVVLAYFVLRRSAKLAIGFWLFAICFVPVWIGASLGVSGNFYVPLASAAAVVVIAALVPASRFRPGITDGLMVLLVLMTVAALFTGNSTIAFSFVVSLFTYFVVGYVLGRVVPARVDVTWIYGLIAVLFTIVAVLAIIEFFSGFNLFVQFKVNNISFATWGSLQRRGGQLRAEGAFGHSIALGSCLALAIPLTLASRFRFWLRVLMILVMMLATALTFSRIGIIGAILGLALSILFLRGSMSIRMRVGLASVGTITALALYPLVSVVFTAAGAEATGSASYRGDLLSLVGRMNVIGVADSARRSADDQVYFGNFRSIDSQLILTGLSGGLLVLVAVVIALVIAVVLVITGRASAPTIAVVAQIPALATAALITQYAIFVWFVIGLAVATQLSPSRRSNPEFERHTTLAGQHNPDLADEPRMPLAHAERGRSESTLKPSKRAKQ
jgi:hypothetical protein